MPQTKTSSKKKEHNSEKNHLKNNMKFAKQVSAKTLSNDNVISNLVMLESKDLKRKRKSKSNHDHDLISKKAHSKKNKLESKYTNDVLVPSPRLVKLETIYPESSSEDDNQLRATITTKAALLKSDRKDNKAEKPIKVKNVKTDTNVKRSLRTTRNSENEEPSKAQGMGDIQPLFTGRSSFEKEKVSHLPIKFKKDKGSDSSFEKESLSFQFNTSKEELDSDTNSENDEKIDERVQSLLKDADSPLGTQKYIPNNFNSESSRDKRPITEKENWIQAFKLYKPEVTEQILDFNLPILHAKYALIRVPKNINPNSLKNLKCSFNKGVFNSKQYLFQPLTRKPEPIFVSLNGPKLLNLEKVIVFQKSVPLLPINHIKVLKKETVSLPEAVKARHPLFGVNYKEKISIEKKIKKKILEAIERKLRLEKKEKQKKHKVKRNYNLDNDETSILDLLNLNR